MTGSIEPVAPGTGVPQPTAGVRWSSVGATALGGTHRLSGQPNQDSYLVAAVNDAAVLVVADGHGSAASFRSDRGSKMATTSGRWLADRLLEATANMDDPVGQLGGVLPTLLAQMVERWQEAVRVDHSLDPIDWNDEGLSPDAATDADLLRAYGSTFLLGLLSDTFAVFAQIGDGDLVVRSSSGTTAKAVAGDERLIANETTSLCHVAVEQDARCSVLDLSTDPLDLVLLATDGYGNAFEEEDWAAGVADDLIDLAAAEGLTWVADNLPTWADDAALVAGDDVTVVVAFAQLR